MQQQQNFKGQSEMQLPIALDSPFIPVQSEPTQLIFKQNVAVEMRLPSPDVGRLFAGGAGIIFPQPDGKSWTLIGPSTSVQSILSNLNFAPSKMILNRHLSQ